VEERRSDGREKWRENELVCVCVCVCVCSYAHICEDKFVQERGVVKVVEVVRFDFLLPRNQVHANE